jgi:hypothetical protein
MALMSGVKVMERRPCWVNGRKGMFHRYIDKTDTVFINDLNIKPDEAEIAKEYFDNIKIVPNGFRVDKIVTTYALIEFEDGHMEEIPPTTITFLEHGDFGCYLWGDEECCMNCKFDHLPSNAARPCYDCDLGGGSNNHFTRK